MNMNNIITIPKKGEFILVPKKEYETLVRRQPKLIQVEKLTASEKHAIAMSDKELIKGDYVTLDQLEHELASSRTKTRKKAH